jgi:hypothetical protein
VHLGRRLVSALCLVGAVACSAEPEPVKKPPAPDMSELVAAYQAPTAELTPETATSVFDSVTVLVDRLTELGLEEQLIDTINTTIEEQLAQVEGATEMSSSALGVESGQQLGKLQQRASKGDAYLLATRICGGYGEEPMPLPENGSITLTLGVSGDFLDPVLWGKFNACKYQLAGNTILLTGQDGQPGSYSIHAGEELKLTDFALSTILMQLSLWAEVNDVGELFEFDFMLNVETLEIATRIQLENGYVIARASTSLVGVSATNGEFGCDAAARFCEAGDQRIEF